MKFLLKWRVHPEKRHEVMKGFSQMSPDDDLSDMGGNIRLIGRWHDVARFEGFAVYESDDAMAMASWALNWNHALDTEVVPVLDDAEARQVGKMKFG